MEDQCTSSLQDAEELEPQPNNYYYQSGEALDESVAPEGWEDLFDWDAYENDANPDPNGRNFNYFANHSEPVFSTYIPEIDNVPLDSRGTVAQVQDQNPWRNPYNDPGEAARQSMLVLPAMNPGIPEDVFNFRFGARQNNNASATVMMPTAPNPPIGFDVDNSRAQDNNDQPLYGFQSSPEGPYKQFPTAGLTNPAGSSPDAPVDTPSRAGRMKQSVEQAKSPSKQSPSKKGKAPATKIVFRKRKATSSPPNNPQELVQPDDNNGYIDTAGNLPVLDNGSATAGSSMNPPPALPDLFSDLAENPLPSSVNNSLVPTPAPSASERRERLKKTLAEYHVDRMTAWKALPHDTRSGFLRDLLRAYAHHRQELEPWELEIINSTKGEERIHGWMDIALEADHEVNVLEQRHNRLRQEFEASKQSEHQLLQCIWMLRRTVEQQEAERKAMEQRIAHLERSHLLSTQILDERIHLVDEKVNAKVKKLEGAIAKLKTSKEGLSEQEDDESGL
ncbi:hypothetical protein B0T20DRAFT_473651 [Sordaria brevicollis]|uniref:Uncharacterized protein n=1 Tax=Sordaria brevicollis TaxID=83679 RepID=A0AAE0NW37_SORBR|nr:hypothetical protein B0T20DRAFT_473651 [Sordaria brevicollis]